jgi:hypothetical protein
MTLTEIRKQLEGTYFYGKEIHKYEKSYIKPNVYIVVFNDGTQTTVKDIYYKEEDYGTT